MPSSVLRPGRTTTTTSWKPPSTTRRPPAPWGVGIRVAAPWRQSRRERPEPEASSRRQRARSPPRHRESPLDNDRSVWVALLALQLDRDPREQITGGVGVCGWPSWAVGLWALSGRRGFWRWGSGC